MTCHFFCLMILEDLSQLCSSLLSEEALVADLSRDC